MLHIILRQKLQKKKYRRGCEGEMNALEENDDSCWGTDGECEGLMPKLAQMIQTTRTTLTGVETTKNYELEGKISSKFQ